MIKTPYKAGDIVTWEYAGFPDSPDLYLVIRDVYKSEDTSRNYEYFYDAIKISPFTNAINIPQTFYFLPDGSDALVLYTSILQNIARKKDGV